MNKYRVLDQDGNVKEFEAKGPPFFDKAGYVQFFHPELGKAGPHRQYPMPFLTFFRPTSVELLAEGE